MAERERKTKAEESNPGRCAKDFMVPPTHNIYLDYSDY